MKKDLKLSCLGIGSLPHTAPIEACELVKSCFKDAPFFPQLAHVSRNEDMIMQILEGFPGLVNSDDRLYVDNESEEFFEKLEEFFVDYEEIIADINSPLLDKYGISEKCSSTFPILLDMIKQNGYKYVKGQVVGAFTLSTSLNDKTGRSIYYDETLREIALKLLTLKILWQIKEFKKADEKIIPIIFMDEPSISQLGTSTFITISTADVINDFKQLTDVIREQGALSAIHCCGKCDWTLPIQGGVDILNLDAYTFAQSLSLYPQEVKSFLENGGMITWGVVPTLDKDALENSTVDSLEKVFEARVNYLVEKGVDKNLIIKNSLISSSCGAGGLSVELSEKAMNLVMEVSERLKEKYSA